MFVVLSTANQRRRHMGVLISFNNNAGSRLACCLDKLRVVTCILTLSRRAGGETLDPGSRLLFSILLGFVGGIRSKIRQGAVCEIRTHITPRCVGSKNVVRLLFTSSMHPISIYYEYKRGDW